MNLPPNNMFKGIAFPIMRRVFPSLISDQIVSVQPMGLPFRSNPFRRLKIKAKKVATPSTYFDYISIANEERIKMLMMRSEGYSRIIAELNNKTERLTKLSEDISRIQAKLVE